MTDNVPTNPTTPLQAVAKYLPPDIRQAVTHLPVEMQEAIEELRLRKGQPLMLVFRDKEIPLTPIYQIAEQHIRSVLELATQASAHTVLHQIQQGYVTLAGGHRIGLCGTAVLEGGRIQTFRHLSSLSIRIAHQIPLAGQSLLPQLLEQGRLVHTLLLSPPGGGKTTLLRDLVRRCSDGIGLPPRRVGLVDERGEVASLYQGCPQLEVGTRTDVIEGCPKVQGLTLLIRGMNPQILAVDEITAGEDVEALATAVGCGVTLLCTAHGGSIEELYQRPLYRPLMELAVFRRVVTIENQGGERRYQVHVLPRGGNALCSG